MKRYAQTLGAVALVCASTGWWLVTRATTPARVQSQASEQAARTHTRATQTTGRAFVALGAVPNPEFTQVSIEQDLVLAQDVFGTGALLFGAGGHTPVLEETTQVSSPDVTATLAQLFAPRGGRNGVYRPTRLTKAQPATLTALEPLLGTPKVLLLYVAGHGLGAEAPLGNTAELWAGDTLSVAQLQILLSKRSARTQLVMTTCFSGGFADVLFEQGDATQGDAHADVCGVFAAPWDEEASGCDPNPERAAQEGYGLHFLEAMRQRDRHGRLLAPNEVDIDGDAQVSLLEAHTVARLRGAGPDDPTTTSERWLEVQDAGLRLPSKPKLGILAEEEWLIAHLMAELALPTLQDVQAHYDAAMADLNTLHARLQTMMDAEASRFQAVAGRMLARWPIVDDPWHPAFASTLAQQGEAISAFLAADESVERYNEAQVASERAQNALFDRLAQTAKLRRLARALWTLGRAEFVRGNSPAAWVRFEQIRACERGS